MIEGRVIKENKRFLVMNSYASITFQDDIYIQDKNVCNAKTYQWKH